MIIRHVQESDLAEVCAIEFSNFPEGVATTEAAFRQRIANIFDSFLVAEIKGQVAGYIEGPVVNHRYLTDDLFHQVEPNPENGGFMTVTSLSISTNFQGQGIGTALIAAMKDLAVAQNRQGISLTCKEQLIGYYESNGFTDEGEAASKHGGLLWYNLVWENPYYK